MNKVMRDREISQLSILKRNDLLTNILKSDDVAGFKAWLDSLFNEESKNINFKENRLSSLYESLVENSIHIRANENLDLAYTVLGAIFKFKSFKCFGLLSCYRNVELLGSNHFNNSLLNMKPDVMHIDIRKYECPEQLMGGRMKQVSFMVDLLRVDESELLNWLNASPEFWKKVFKTDIKYTNNSQMETYQEWKELENILRLSDCRNSKIVIAMFKAGLLGLDACKNISEIRRAEKWNRPDVKVLLCHPETWQRIENFILKKILLLLSTKAKHVLYRKYSVNL